MNHHNHLKIRHHVILLLAIIGILSTLFSFSTRGFSLQSIDDMVENLLYPAADLLLLGAVAAYFWKKERLSKILAVIGLGIFLIFLVAGTILALLMGGVPVFLYFYIFGILLADGILFYLFLRDE